MGDALAQQSSCILLQSMLKDERHPIIIGIAGDSGSGKTTFSVGIRSLLGDALVQTIETDGYHKENRKQREISKTLPLDPDANRLDVLLDHLRRLKRGETIEVPRYNHSTGDFDVPKTLSPSSIIIVEGLHALYPQFLPYLDFRIFCDPCREVKRQWKYERDMKKRGHSAEKLETEMIMREAAYKRWIDFQKTSATVVIKIFHTTLRNFARYEFYGKLPSHCFKVELIMEPAERPLPSVLLPFDLASLMDASKPPFLLASVPCNYWGRRAIDIHVDGILSEKTIAALEREIRTCTDISVKESIQIGTAVTATEFTQLLIAWRFLEQIISQKNRSSDSV